MDDKEKRGETAEGGADATAPTQGSGALIEPPEEAVARLEREVADLKDKYLRLAAEYDNFRKRALPAQTDAKTIHDGVDLVERKLWKELEAAGVTRVDQSGVPFDPNLHEAVTTQAADHPAKDHTVGAVLQPGYQMRGALIRPARVVVLQWKGDQGPGTGDGS